MQQLVLNQGSGEFALDIEASNETRGRTYRAWASWNVRMQAAVREIDERHCTGFDGAIRTAEGLFGFASS